MLCKQFFIFFRRYFVDSSAEIRLTDLSIPADKAEEAAVESLRDLLQKEPALLSSMMQHIAPHETETCLLLRYLRARGLVGTKVH